MSALGCEFNVPTIRSRRSRTWSRHLGQCWRAPKACSRHLARRSWLRERERHAPPRPGSRFVQLERLAHCRLCGHTQTSTRRETTEARVREMTELLAQALEKLHVPGRPLLCCNVWDVPTARIALRNTKTRALATASFAVAEVNGLADDDCALAPGSVQLCPKNCRQ